MPFDFSPVDAVDEGIPAPGGHLVRITSAELLTTRHGTQIKVTYVDDQAGVQWTAWYRAEGDLRWQAHKFCQAFEVLLDIADEGSVDDQLQRLEGGAAEVLVRHTGRKDDGSPWVNTDPVRYLGTAPSGSTRTDVPIPEAELTPRRPVDGRQPLATPLPLPSNGEPLSTPLPVPVDDDDEPIPF